MRGTMFMARHRRYPARQRRSEDGNRMQRIDTHFHIWDLETYRYPWLQEGPPPVRAYGSSASMRHSYRLENYLDDARGSGICGAVYVQCYMDDPLLEARYIQGLADTHAAHFDLVIVAYADLTQADAHALLPRLAALPSVRGIRNTAAWHPDPILSFAPRPGMLSEANTQAGFAALADLGLRFDCMIYPQQMEDLARLAERAPSVPVILNHAGMPLRAGDPDLARWRDGMRLLAALPQVSVKISGLGMVIRDWAGGGADDVIDETIEIFGVDRCMFASNYPIERVTSTFGDTYGAFDRATAHRSDEERHKLFSRNAARIYAL
jgi:predicted TIM-barrel fold metal-dependent hydrolase